MTDAEQVACDALRSAGLDEVADNLEWVKAALRHRDAVHTALLAVECAHAEALRLVERWPYILGHASVTEAWDRARREMGIVGR